MTLCLATPSPRCQRNVANLLFQPPQEIAKLRVKRSDKPPGCADQERRTLEQIQGDEEYSCEWTAGEGSGRPLRVLLVDDNRALAELTAVLLRSDGHDVHIACDGPSALECVPAYRPDVIFTDISLPGMSGCTLASTLRAREETKHIFLAAVTGYALEDYPEADFDCHFAKPVDPDVLRRLLADVANGRK
jgi:CheY-like chemotaxis protein